jgi:hypothetical protein
MLCGDARVLRYGTMVIAAGKPGRRGSRQGNRSPFHRRHRTPLAEITGKGAVRASTGATFTEREAAVIARNNDPAGGGALL